MPTGDEQSASFFSESLLKDVPSLQKLLEASPEDPTRQGLERPDEAIEKMSAEAAHQQYETALLRGAAEVAERWRKVESLLPPLEQSSSNPHMARLTMTFQKVERNAVYATLYFCSVPPLLARALSHVGPPIAALQRRVTALRLLCKKKWSRAARKDLRDRLYKASKIVRENQERQRWLGPSCPALSAAITLLTTYLSQCVALESKFGGMAAKYYQKSGKIMEAFSSPRCLACGVHHSFTDWRRVKARDQYKGVWTQAT